MNGTTFREKLWAAQQTSSSWLCVGLDPSHTSRYGALLDYCIQIIQATADVVSAYKLNLGFFQVHAAMGLDALKEVLAHIPKTIPVILDAKFGDIGSTAKQYARYTFDRLKIDAVTLNPYIGTDALTPFLAYHEKGIFALCRTSNVQGNEFQTLDVGGKPLYQHVAVKMAALGERYPSQVGLVVGATQGGDLRLIREAAPMLPFLVPGIGAQGGDLGSVVKYGLTADGLGPVINIGRAILYASTGEDFAAAARLRAIEYRDQINILKAKSV